MGWGTQTVAPPAKESMPDSDDELFSSARSEPVTATALAVDDEAVGMASATMKYLKLGAAENEQWAATCMRLSSTFDDLGNQKVFWHLRDFFYHLGFGVTIRLDQWLRSPPPRWRMCTELCCLFWST